MKELCLGLFIAVMIGVGIYSKKRVKNSNDFLLGGRNVGGWVSAFSYGTAYFSAVIFIGYAGAQGWEFGLPITWIGISNALVGCFLAWKVLAKRTRTMTRRLDARTMPEFFERRYNSQGMKLLAVLIIFIFLVPYTASVYKGLGYILVSSFNIDFKLAIFLMALLTALYLLLGGYVATSLNDLIQGIIMLVGCICMVVFVVKNPMVGGLSGGLQGLHKIDPNLASIFPALDKALPLLGLILMTSFGVWGLPQMIHKYYAIKDDEAIRKGTVISTLFALVIGGAAYFTGALGRLFFINPSTGAAVMPKATATASSAEMIIPRMLEHALPAALMGIIIVLILSASMSTLASLVLVSSSSMSIDFVKGFVYPKLSDRAMVILMRILCFIFVAVSFILATINSSTIVNLMSLSWGMISGMFLGPYVCGIWWKRTTRKGAWAGFAGGGIVMLVGTVLLNRGMLPAVMTSPVIASLAMLVSLVSVIAVSLITVPMDAEYIIRAFGNTAIKVSGEEKNS